MNSERITNKAKWLHKGLIIGLAAISLTGILSGCHKNPVNTNTNLQEVLTNHQLYSNSLGSLIGKQFKSSLMASDSDSASDALFHDGNVETCNDNGGDKYFKDYGKTYDEIMPSDDNSKDSRQVVHYHINNPDKTITFTSSHEDNTLASITYKLVRITNPQALGMTTSMKRHHYYHFEPIRLRRFGHKHSAKIPAYIAKHNELNIQSIKRVRSKNAKSLNNVQRE